MRAKQIFILFFLLRIISCGKTNAQPFERVSGFEENVPGIADGTVLWCDFDGDGDPDPLISGNTVSGPSSMLFTNDGNDVFTPVNAGLRRLAESAASWGDNDNDPRPADQRC